MSLYKKSNKLDSLNHYDTHLLCVLERLGHNYRLTTAHLLLQVNLDKIMHTRCDFDASSARTRRVSALDKYQN